MVTPSSFVLAEDNSRQSSAPPAQSLRGRAPASASKEPSPVEARDAPGVDDQEESDSPRASLARWATRGDRRAPYATLLFANAKIGASLVVAGPTANAFRLGSSPRPRLERFRRPSDLGWRPGCKASSRETIAPMRAMKRQPLSRSGRPTPARARRSRCSAKSEASLSARGTCCAGRAPSVPLLLARASTRSS
jgi:hypothetical protein